MLKISNKQGMLVEKIHEVVSYNQSKWLKKYIKCDTIKRNEAQNDFEKNFYELLNDAFIGKTMEIVRNWKLFEMRIF